MSGVWWDGFALGMFVVLELAVGLVITGMVLGCCDCVVAWLPSGLWDTTIQLHVVVPGGGVLVLGTAPGKFPVVKLGTEGWWVLGLVLWLQGCLFCCFVNIQA